MQQLVIYVEMCNDLVGLSGNSNIAYIISYELYRGWFLTDSRNFTIHTINAITEMHRPKTKDIQKRCLFACQCSGSTRILRIFAESPECAVSSPEMITSAISVGAPSGTDAAMARTPANSENAERAISDGKEFWICRQDVGRDTIKDACAYWPPPTPPEVMLAKPVFLVRDPIRVFDSWKQRGWTDVQRLIDCFSTLFRLMKDANSSSAACLLYEQLAHQPHGKIKQICSYWGVPYRDEMLNFPARCVPSYLGDDTAIKGAPGNSQTLRSWIVVDVPCHGLVSNTEKATIETSIGRVYLDCWQNHLWRLSDVLAEKQWIGFDLDDTLHEFRRASSAATNAVLASMSEAYGVQYDLLKGQYKEVLRKSTAHAFSDGKSSHEYRRDRFVAVAGHFSLPLKHDGQFLTELLSLYENALKEALELKSGALSLLRAIKDQGKKIAIITEGPQDAQEWTIKNLGISPYVDFLATTNHFKVSKTDGLFPRVLGTLGITPSEIAYVGDSEHKDMIPAADMGVFCLHFAEDKNCNLECYPPRMNTLNKLEHILLSQRETVIM